MYVFYFLSMFGLNFSTIANTDKHGFITTWKWISSCNGVINHADCVIQPDVYLQKMHLSSKNISGTCSKNIRGISRKNIS